MVGLLYANGGEAKAFIINEIASTRQYFLTHGVLDTRHFGLPHARRRVYFVGVRRDLPGAGQYVFPADPKDPHASTMFSDRCLGETGETTPTAEPNAGCILQYLDVHDVGVPGALPEGSRARQNVLEAYTEIQNTGGDPGRDPWVVDCDSSPSRSRAYYDYSPCITRSRYRGFWVSCLNRRIRARELLRLKGLRRRTVGF